LKILSAKSAEIENPKMGLFLNSGAISQFQDPVKNLDRENFRPQKFLRAKISGKKISGPKKIRL
jgi:uncharacterized membrane protein YqiK